MFWSPCLWWCLPLAILSILLAVLLFRFRIRPSQIDAPEFQPVLEQEEPGVYYITIASATFVLLSSYSSRFAHVMIIGYFMTLIFLETQAPERYDSRLPTNSHYCLDGSKETFLVYGDTCASRSGEDDQRPLDY